RGLLYHHVHKDRLDQGWFRRRMAWQSVSDALTETGLGDTERYLASAAAAASKLDIDGSFLNCFTYSDDPEVIEAQLDFLKRFTAAAISSDAKLSASGAETIRAKIRSHMPALQEAEERIAALSGQLAEAEQAQAALLASTSWKVTEPLRVI